MLLSDRQVTEEEGREWAKLHGLHFVEASAKTAANVEQVYNLVNRKSLMLFLLILAGILAYSKRDTKQF